MGVPLAGLDDLEDLWRPLDQAGIDPVRAARLLEKASALLRHASPSVDGRIAAGTLSPVVVATVVANMVRRYLVNPDGVATQTQSVGPYSQSLSFVDRAEGTNGKAPIKGQLQVTKADLESLRPYQPNAKIGSIRVRPSLAPSPFTGLPSADLIADLADERQLTGYLGDDFGLNPPPASYDQPPADQ